MIRYALVCGEAHEFEAWFASSEAYDRQAQAGLVECPVCGSLRVRKQIMAPAVSTSTRSKGAVEPAPPSGSGRDEAPSSGGMPYKDFEAFAAKVRAHIRRTHVYVGDKFAAEARAMHEGVKEEAPIYGEATPAEAEKLREDGAPVAPLPDVFAPTPPKKAN